LFYREFTNLYLFGNYVRPRAQARCNLVFFLQLSLVHKDKVLKDSEIYTSSTNSTECNETHI